MVCFLLMEGVVGRPGRDSHMKWAGLFVGNFEWNPLKETNLGVAQPLFEP